MSFSQSVKEELSNHMPAARHCMIAEIAAIISLCGRIVINVDDKYSVKVHTENVCVARKYFTLVEKAFNIKAEITIRQNAYLRSSRTYTITVNDHINAIRILQAVKLINGNMEIEENLSIINNVIIMKNCCRRAFLRGAFLSVGSISKPEKSYHFEMVCTTMAKAMQLCDIIKSFELDAKIVERKKHFVVYIKDGESIVDMLNIMEAHVSLMELINIRIIKEMRNTVNRKVNCETANLNKTVSASVKQIEDIRLIQDTIGLLSLKRPLQEIAVIRLENPDASLKELGAMLSPAVGKSGVNHRLRKLSEIADGLRH